MCSGIKRVKLSPNKEKKWQYEPRSSVQRARAERLQGQVDCVVYRAVAEVEVLAPTARLACTFTLCCTSEAMPLFWLAIMMPAAD